MDPSRTCGTLADFQDRKGTEGRRTVDAVVVGEEQAAVPIPPLVSCIARHLDLVCSRPLVERDCRKLLVQD